MFTSEETPLLLGSKHDAIYSRFSDRKKRVLVMFISCCSFCPMFISGSFIPTIPQIALDLNTTPSIIASAVSISILSASLGTLLGASNATYYGRRPVYLVGLPLFCLGSLGVACSTTIPMLMGCRILQAIGASPGTAVGSAVIGDIYRLEQRGTGMGIFQATSLIGLVLAPPVGGFFAAYFSWRVLQLCMGILGAILFVCIYLFFPETSHPGARGIDKVPAGSPKLVVLNPLRPLWLLRKPNLLAISIATTTVLLTDSVMMIPLSYTFGVRYHVTSPALLGACFIPGGIGSLVGGPIGGRLSDALIQKLAIHKKGALYPEDRLRSTLFSASFVVPVTVLVCALVIEYIAGIVGLVVCLLVLFVNGVGLSIVYGVCATYAVDVMHERSAEAVAAISSLRSFLLACSISGIIPLIETLGLIGTNAIAACLAWCGAFLLYAVVKASENVEHKNQEDDK